ncbi:flagellar filament capping protein FliD [Natranaerobius trueperi]|nr:flagellar filament capping protein FliD [Natranaerobius trueperi]
MRLGGIVSGFDTQGLIDELMSIEKRPIKRIEDDIDKIEDTKEEWREVNKSIQSLIENVSSLQDEDTYLSMDASASEDGIEVKAGKNALERSYDLEVMEVSRAHRIASGEIVEFSSIDDRDELELGIVGDLEIKISGETFTFEIKEEDTLQDVVDKINNSENKEEEDVAVEAEIMGDRLILQAKNTGSNNQIEIGGDETVYGLDGLNLKNEDGFVNELEEGKNAEFTINGLYFENESNSIDDIITDVTIDISEAEIGEARVSISMDESKAVETLEGFVDKFNEVYSGLLDKSRVTVTDDEVDSGSLQGDSLIRNVTRNIRTMITDPVDGFIVSEIGLEIDRYGEMSFDKDTFTDKLTEDSSRVYEGLDEIASRVIDYLEGISYEEGARDGVKRKTSIGNRKLNLDNQIDRNEGRIESLERRLERREDNLWRQYSRMEQAMSQVFSESNWLYHQFMN